MANSDRNMIYLSSGLSPRAYWALSLLLVAGYLAVWLANFHNIYGWHIDDWTCYTKGLNTVRDPKQAFGMCNALQPYFFIYSYLPIWSGVSIPSYELPIYGPWTGNYRFFLLWTILYHGLMALGWAWFAGGISGNRTAALISTFLLLSSEEFVLWTPQPDSRLVGLPLALVAIWLIVRPGGAVSGSGWRRAAWLFLSGSLFGLAQSLHYTALYLIIPMAASVWLWELRDGWRRRRWWLGWVAFAAGCVWQQGLLELLSHYWVGLPWSEGPTAFLWGLNKHHAAACRVWEGALFQGVQWMTLIGWPMCLAALLGAWAWLRRIPFQGGLTCGGRASLLTGLVLGMAFVFCLPTVPVFRKFSPLLPLLYLLAAVGILWLASVCARKRSVRWAVGLLLLAWIDMIPLQQSAEVFQAHLGLGRAIHWARRQNHGRALRWMVVHRPYFYTLDDLSQDDPKTLVLTYFPLHTMLCSPPRLSYGLNTARPLYRQPNLVATQSLGAGLWMRTTMAERRSDILSEARVYRAGDLARCVRARRKVRIAELEVDSSLGPLFEAANLFDHNASPDGFVTWKSADTPPAHYIRLAFQEPVELNKLALLQKVIRIIPGDTPRVDKLHVRVAPPNGGLRTVWMGSRLADQQVITATFREQTVERIELVLWSRGRLFGATDMVEIEEILFPGFQVEGPPPAREFSPLILDRVERRDHVLVACGQGITPHTRLMVNGRVLPPDFSHVNRETLGVFFHNYAFLGDRLDSRLPGGLYQAAGECIVRLTDGLRVSNCLTVNFTDRAQVSAVSARAAGVEAGNPARTSRAPGSPTKRTIER